VLNPRNIFTTLVVIIVGISCSIEDDYQQPNHQDWLKTHPYSVGQTTLLLVDSSRDRPVKTEIWYPTQDTTKPSVSSEYPFELPPTSKDVKIVDGKHPLIVLSHGTGGNRMSLMWLACELVGKGYIVAAVDHFGNTYDNSIPEHFVKIWDRPKDISFLLDELFAHAAWNSKIDPAKIGMVGFSLGGYTTIALAGGQIDYKQLHTFSKTAEGQIEFTLLELGNVADLLTPAILSQGERENKNLKDERIGAFVALAPALGQGFQSKTQLEALNSPILIIAAQRDERTPIQTNAKHYRLLIEQSKYLELEGEVGHYIFMNVAKAELRNNAPIIFKDKKSVKRAEVHQQVAHATLDFFERNLK